jgi:hypothetical protein
LTAKLSNFAQFFDGSKGSQGRKIENPFVGMRNSLLGESFPFITKESVIEMDGAEAAALSPAVQDQLSVDGCARKVFVKDSGIEITDIHSLQLFLFDVK